MDETISRDNLNSEKIGKSLDFILRPGSVLELAKKTANEDNYSALKKGVSYTSTTLCFELPRIAGYLYLASEVGKTLYQL
ncbi:MAG: hypothetical protein R6U34_05070 [Thioalkalivibrio sp.]